MMSIHRVVRRPAALRHGVSLSGAACAVSLTCAVLLQPLGGLADSHSDDELRETLRARARGTVSRLERATARLEESRRAYSRLRGNRRAHGEEKLTVLTEAAQAEADVIDAQEELEDLFEEARGDAVADALREFEDYRAPDLAVELSAAAETPEQHRAAALNFRERAARHRAQARRHRDMATGYAAMGGRDGERLSEHCARLGDIEEELAGQYERLAEGHEAHAEQ